MNSRICTIDDMRKLKLQELQLSENPMDCVSENLSDEQINALLEPYARTLEHEGVPVACYGIVIRWPGLGEVWGMFSQTALDHPTHLARDVRAWLEIAEEFYELHRIQTSAPVEHAAAHRWLMHLGFVPEARLVGYGVHGGTHILYGRVK